ncbi:MAG: tetratricopeptide repeat protein [Acidobacteriaceae bacterium]|nr:tetratricopeptide repeat protein [Acidobacteriaceae bacterium]
MKALRCLALVGTLCALLLLAANVPQSENQLWEHRNLGKAFYENPDTHLQAVQQLKAALDLKPDSVRERINYGLALLRAGQTEAGRDELLKAQKQDPSLPYTWFNLGIAYKRAGEYDKAIEQFQGMLRLVPTDPISHYNLGAVYRSKGDPQAALAEFLQAEKLNPDLAGPHFQLFTLYQRAGNKDEAARERQLFEEAKKRNEGAAVPEDMEWNFYAELYDPPEPRPAAADEPTRYDDKTVSTGWDPMTTGMLLIDSDGSGRADLLVWSRDRIELLKHGTDPVKTSGLEDLKDIRSIAPGDFDNDGLADLCIITGSGASVYRNNHGTFTKYVDLPNTAGTSTAFWLDYDHDYDLDLLLFGPNSVLMRNDGNGKFEDKTAAFPFVKGQATDAVAFAVRGDTAARDVVVSYADRPAVLYRDKLNGHFEAGDFLALPAGATALSVQDVNRDGLLDIVSYQPKVVTVLGSQPGPELERAAQQNPDRQGGDNRGSPDPSPITADFNDDNREDYARILPDGSLHVYLNSSSTQRWMTVRIQGVKNVKDGVGATVEVKSGAYYAKKVYLGVPLPFAADARADIDTVRITWPNGLIQNEPHQKIAGLKIEEAQRLSGSCPMIFTWNGQKFQFITDVLGVAPLGASSGDGNYFPVDHNEYIQVPGSALKPQDGSYNVHITEELHEVSYLDQVQLIAVDHPGDIDIYTNDKFKSPPYPEFRLFGARAKIHPVRATEAHGVDATARVARIDHAYPDAFKHNSSGVAELHTLDLDFGDAARSNHAALVLNGWVDWADGSTFLGASQNGTGLIFPYLQVKDSSGNWKTVVEDMGIPSGKPKTIVVDLAGKFLSRSREVRIVTNLCVYWDEIFLIDDSSAPPVRLTRLNADSADLHFRGFSRPLIDRTRQQPEQFLYDQVRPISNWNPTPGFYTRYGDVQPLVQAADDRMVIMGSGDELKLRFAAGNLPALPEGWKRDYLLLVDGWAKDADANTAYSETVLPLPFHAMSAYPYKSDEHFPDDPEHRQYVKEYLTRPALRLIRPLAATALPNPVPSRDRQGAVFP